MQIEGQAAIVTGGGSGLGAQTARALAQRGARVTVLDINEAGAAAVAQEIGGLGLRCDITDPASVEAALATAAQRHGVARILMNIAGIGSAKRIVGKDGRAAPLEDFRRVIEVNLIGTYNVCRLAAAGRRIAAAGAGVAGRQHSLPEAPGQARGIRAPGRRDRREPGAQRRSHPPRRRAAHGTALSAGRPFN